MNIWVMVVVMGPNEKSVLKVCINVCIWNTSLIRCSTHSIGTSDWSGACYAQLCAIYNSKQTYIPRYRIISIIKAVNS